MHHQDAYPPGELRLWQSMAKPVLGNATFEVGLKANSLCLL